MWPWDAFPRPHSFRAGQKSGPRAFGSARFRLPGYVISIARLSNSGGFSHSPFYLAHSGDRAPIAADRHNIVAT